MIDIFVVVVEWLCVCKGKEYGGVCVWANIFICVEDIVHDLQENWNYFRSLFAYVWKEKQRRNYKKIKMSYDETQNIFIFKHFP